MRDGYQHRFRKINKDADNFAATGWHAFSCKCWACKWNQKIDKKPNTIRSNKRYTLKTLPLGLDFIFVNFKPGYGVYRGSAYCFVYQ
jgi:hypothetical protein